MELKDICKAWGCLNNYDWGFAPQSEIDAFRKANEEHDKMMKADPAHHVVREVALNARGTYTRCECKCGFSYTVDSSD